MRNIGVEYAKYIGRVGALAVALGVGAAVATAPGVSLADPTGPSVDSTTDTVSANEGTESSTAGTPTDSGDDPTSTGPSGPPPMEQSNSGGAIESAPDEDDGETTPDGREPTTIAETPPAESGTDAAREDDSSAAPRRDAGGGRDSIADDARSGSQPKPNPAAAGVASSNPEPKDNAAALSAEPAVESASKTVATAQSAAVAVTAESVTEPGPATVQESAPIPNQAVSSVALLLGLAPTLSNLPQLPVESPALWALLAAARRQVGEDVPEQSAGLKASEAGTTTSLALAAGEQVDVAVGRDPSGVAVTGDRAYVANQYDKTVSVVDTTTNAVVAIITVASSPTAIAASPAGDRVYVATKSNNSVAVINTATNTVLTNIKVGAAPAGLAVSPDGSRVYVSNGGSTTLSVINTATNTEIKRITVGSAPAGVAVSPDGSRVYVTTRFTDQVAVINAVTNTVLTKVTVGDSPREVALTPDGTRAYVTNTDGTVSVINTATNTTAGLITVGPQPVGVAISPDGAVAYVANGNDTVSVIDTASNTVINTLTTDTAPESGAHSVAVSEDGQQIYVVDTRDRVLRVISTAGVTPNDPPVAEDDTSSTDEDTPVTIDVLANDTDVDGDALTPQLVTGPSDGEVTLTADGRFTYTPDENFNGTDTFTYSVTDGVATSNTATVTITVNPVADDTAPEVGDPSYTVRLVDPANGQVHGTLNVDDEDGDPLTYTVTDGPANGTVVIDSATGRFIFTPTDAARLTAGLTAGADSDTFTVSVTDGGSPVEVTATVPISAAELTILPGGFGNYQLNAQFPEALTMTPDGRIYVGHFDDSGFTPGSTVSVIFPGGFVDEIPVGGGGHEALQSSPDGSRVYVTGAHGTIAVIDTETNSVIGTPSAIGVRPVAMAISPDGSRLYVTSGQCCGSGDDDFLTVVDAALVGSGADPVLARIPIAYGQYPGGLVVSPDGRRVYVATVSGRSIAVIDTVSNTIVDNINLGVDVYGFDVFPNDVAISPDGTKLYVTTSPTTVFAVVDLTTRTVVRYTPRHSGHHVVMSPDGSLAYVVTFNDTTNNNELWVVRTADNEVIDIVDIGDAGSRGPFAVSPDGTRIYLGDFINDSVTVVSLFPAMPSAV